jgi:hypothetical protein
MVNYDQISVPSPSTAFQNILYMLKHKVSDLVPTFLVIIVAVLCIVFSSSPSWATRTNFILKFLTDNEYERILMREFRRRKNFEFAHVTYEQMFNAKVLERGIKVEWDSKVLLEGRDRRDIYTVGSASCPVVIIFNRRTHDRVMMHFQSNIDLSGEVRSALEWMKSKGGISEDDIIQVTLTGGIANPFYREEYERITIPSIVSALKEFKLNYMIRNNIGRKYYAASYYLDHNGRITIDVDEYGFIFLDSIKFSSGFIYYRDYHRATVHCFEDMLLDDVSYPGL